MRVLNLHWNPGVQIDMIRIDYSVGRSFKYIPPPLKKHFLQYQHKVVKKCWTWHQLLHVFWTITLMSSSPFTDVTIEYQTPYWTFYRSDIK